MKTLVPKTFRCYSFQILVFVGKMFGVYYILKYVDTDFK